MATTEQTNQTKSRARRMQEAAALATEKTEEVQESIIRITIRTATGYEYHLDKPESVVRDIINPEVPDALIEVPIPKGVNIRHRFIHTNQIAELDVHDKMEF